MKTATYVLILVAAISAVVIGIKSTTVPITSSVLGLFAWAISPYFYLAFITKLASTPAAKAGVLLLSLLVGGFGAWLFIDAIFVHADPQGGLVFVVAPLWQWALLILASAPLYFLNKAKHA
jgi:hypothetical protein